MTLKHVFTSPVVDATGTLSVWAGSTTATVAASNLVLPSGWNSEHLQTLTLAGNTLGVSSLSGTDIVFAAGSNVTFSGIQGANVATVSMIGGTGEVGTGTTFGGTNISGSMTLNSAGLALSLSGGAGGGGGSINVSAGTTSNNLTNFVMSNSNNVSFGLNGSTITATANARASNDGIGLNTAQTNVTWTVNSSGLSLDAAGYAGTGTTFGGTNISGSITQNSNGIALSLSGLAALTSQSNQALSAANGSFTFQTAQFSNANGVSFVTSAGSAIAASVNTAYVGLNTAQTNVTWTVNSSGISLNAAGYAGTGTTFNGANISGSITQNSVGLNLSLSVAAPGAANINVSAGTTSNNVTQIVFSNSNGVTFGLDGSTVTASAAGGGGGGATLSYWAISHISAAAVAATFSGSGSTSNIQPLILPAAMSFSFLRGFASISTNSTSFGTAVDTSYAWLRETTHNVMIYTRGTGNSSQSLYSYASASLASRALVTLTAGATGSHYSVGGTNTYGDVGGTSTVSFSYATSQTRFDLSTESLTNLTGGRYLDIPFATSLSAGNYWAMFGLSFNSAATGSNVGTNLVAAPASMICNRNLNTAFNRLGLADNDSNQAYLGVGSFSTAGGGSVSELGFSNISSITSHIYRVFELIRSA